MRTKSVPFITHSEQHFHIILKFTVEACHISCIITSEHLGLKGQAKKTVQCSHRRWKEKPSSYHRPVQLTCPFGFLNHLPFRNALKTTYWWLTECSRIGRELVSAEPGSYICEKIDGFPKELRVRGPTAKRGGTLIKADCCNLQLFPK